MSYWVRSHYIRIDACLARMDAINAAKEITNTPIETQIVEYMGYTADWRGLARKPSTWEEWTEYKRVKFIQNNAVRYRYFLVDTKLREEVYTRIIYLEAELPDEKAVEFKLKYSDIYIGHVADTMPSGSEIMRIIKEIYP